MTVPPYRALFLTIFGWARGWAPDKIAAAGVTGVVLCLCHFLNLAAALTLLHPRSGRMFRLYQLVAGYPIVFVGIIVAYFWYFISRIDKWTIEDDDGLEYRPGRVMNAIAGTYLCLTIVATIAAIII